jgi:hypothetical protein
MRRIVSVLGIAALTLVATALPALAGYAPPPPGPGGGHGGTAFTGATGIPVWVALLAATLVVGIAALVVGRRLSASRS